MGNVIATDTTDANGDYLFEEVPTGTYTVQEIDPAGYSSVVDGDNTPAEGTVDPANTDTNDNLIPVFVDPGEDDEDNDFVDVPTTEISGTVLEDIDGDGVGDEPIEGVIITLIDEDGNVVATDTTDANGDYEFEDIVPGIYTVTEMDPDGYTSVSDTDGGDPNSIEVTANSGMAATGNDFVDEQPGTISGIVQEDTDNDDLGDTPVEGVIVTLLDDMGAVVDTDTTDANGAYEFTGVTPGEYTVVETDPTDFTSVSDDDETPVEGATTDPANTDTNDNSIPVYVDPGEDDADNNFVDEQLGSISGTVTEQIIADGDVVGEVPNEGVIVNLLDDMGNVIATDTTDANGDYLFEDVPTGNYTVQEVDPVGYASVMDDDNSPVEPTTDPANTDTNDNLIPVFVDPGEDDEDNDFVDVPTQEISGTVLEDIDGDGVGDEPIEGVVITLLDEDGNVVAMDTTDANGDYEFEDVTPGIYTVTEMDLDGFTSVSDVDGGDPNSIEVTVNSGMSVSDQDFVDEQPGSISGIVQEDTDNDDLGDTPIEGVIVTLLDDMGNVVATDTTDAAGMYEFTDVTPGEYTVTETNPMDFISVSDDDETPVEGATTDPANTDTNDDSIPVYVDPGEDDADNNFVDEELGSIDGTVLEDTNNDDIGDDPIEGVVIVLLDEDGNVVAMDTTDADGNFSFDNVPPGDYTVTEQDPDGYTSVGDSDGGDPNTIDVTVTSGEPSSGNEFVDEQLGTISGTVFKQENIDLPIDLIPCEGAIVNLLDDMGNIIATDTTDENGDYLFEDLPTGDYTVQEIDPDGFASVSDMDNSPVEGTVDPANTDTNDNLIPVFLDPGEDDEDNDFVDVQTNNISGTVFEDIDGDGVGDDPIEGVIITLLDDMGNVIATDTTDANGDYEFEDLVPGIYTVTEMDPDGYTSVNDSDGGDPNSIEVILTSTASSTGNDFVDEQPGTISGIVQEDTNNDDLGDTPIEGVVITLLDDMGAVVATDTTDADGMYEFTDVTPGEYTVTETNPADFTSVSDDDETPVEGATTDPANTDTNDDSIPVYVDPGEDDADNNFVDEQLGSISGTVTEQIIADGDVVGEVPNEGVIVNLLDDMGNVIATDTTDANGDYLFEDVPTGNYTVQEVDPVGYASVMDDDNSPVEPTTDPANTDTNDNLIPVFVDPGEDDEDNDFVDVPTQEISGTVLEDIDGDGVGDEPIEGVVITLLDEDGNVVAMDTTDANGDYEFEDVTPGIYTVTEMDLDGYTSVSDTDGGDPNSIEVTVNSGMSVPGNDFVDEQPGSISGVVTEDIDNDDIGDDPIEGVVITLLDDMGVVVATDTTDADGMYEFTDVTPGEYTVTETNPADFTSVNDDDETPVEGATTDPANTDTNDDSIPVYVDPGEDDADNNFVDEQLGTISGTVTEQIVADGDVVGEVPNEGVIVNLLDDMGNIIATDTTDVDGNYLFEDLPTGDYTVEEIDPDGYASVMDDDNSPVEPTTDPANTNTNDNMIPVFLDPGEDDEDNDFVDVPTSEISGFVLEDIDGDGTGDEPIEGVVITLLDDMGNVIAMDTTDANGFYDFEDLEPGDYTVTETDPADFTSVGDADGGDPNSIDVTLNSGTSSTDNNFIDEQIITTIFGQVYFDTNNNGDQDPGEPNIPNVDVVIEQADGTFITVETNSLGEWSSEIIPGMTTAFVDTLDADFPADAIQTEGTNPNTIVAVEGTDNDGGIDGFYLPTTVFGVVYYDTNNNGVQDGDEPGLEGIDVIIVDDSGTPQIVQTDSLGNWSAMVVAGMVEALVDTMDTDFPDADVVQTEGTNPTTITAILGMDNDMGNDGYYYCITIDVQVLLEGSIIESSYAPASSDGIMRTELNDRRFLPGQDNLFIFAGDTPAGQPYSAMPWDYMGTEGDAFDYTVVGDPLAGYPTDITDWVLVSLRTTLMPDSEVCKRAALLRNDGQIIFLEEFDCCDALSPAESYYLVIEHRNHMPVMTPVEISPTGGVISYDFRVNQSYQGIFGSAAGQKEFPAIGGGIFAMHAGNPDQIGPGDVQDINVSDKAVWSQQTGLDTGYYISDVNMDGDINSDDRIIIENNLGLTSGIIFNY